MLFEAKTKLFDAPGLEFGGAPVQPSPRPGPDRPIRPGKVDVPPTRHAATLPGISPMRLRRLQTDFRDAFELVQGTLPVLFRDRWVSWYYDADTVCFHVLDRSGETILRAQYILGTQWEARLHGRIPLTVNDRSIFGVFRKLGLLAS